MVLLALVFGAAAQVVPLSDVRFDVVVSGPLADIEITQTWRNDSLETIEATYLFPLHEGAVVDRMVMRLDDRTIEGVIEEVEAAKIAYDAAIAAGQTAALTTAERWNLFKQRVGNIPPGAEVEVTLRVIQPVPRLDGRYELLLPLAAGARFVPPGLSDAEALNMPVGESSVRAHVRVEVDSGVPIEDFACVSHEAFEAPTGDGWSVAASDLAMTHDFVVGWSTVGDVPQVGALHDGRHLLLVFEPPEIEAYEARRPRELVFVLDRSGSMQGPGWEVAREALRRTLATLTQDDHVGLVQFAGRVDVGAIRPATREWLSALDPLLAGGVAGTTDIAGALRAALEAPGDPARQRYVVLVTDGLVGDEDAVLKALVDARGDSRVSALGVGGASNRFLLEEVAALGGGTAHYLRTFDTGPMQDLVEALDRPTLSGISLDWGDWAPTDVAPPVIPDVHLGRPFTVVARTRNEEGGPIAITGVIGGEEVTLDVRPRLVERGRAIASAWARRQIDALGRRQVLTGVPARDEGLPLALEYGILSPWTAFLAVDPRERAVRTARIDVPLASTPVGMDGSDDGFDGERPFQPYAPKPEFLAGGETPYGVPADAREQRSTQQATNRAAGISVGPTTGGNPSIGGAATNESLYVLDGAPVVEPSPAPDVSSTTRDVTREYLQRVPVARSFDSSGEEAVAMVSRTSGVYAWAHPWRAYGADRTPGPAPLPSASSLSLRPGTLTVPGAQIDMLLGSTDAMPRSGLRVLAQGGPGRASGGVDLAGSTRQVTDGSWSTAPGQVFARLGRWDGFGLDITATGALQDIHAPTPAAFTLARRGGEVGLRLGGPRVWMAGDVGANTLRGDPDVRANRRFFGGTAGLQESWGPLQLGVRGRARNARLALGVGERTATDLGGYAGLSWTPGGFVARASSWVDVILVEGDADRVLAPEFELGVRPLPFSEIVLGASRTADVSTPELALPIRSAVYGAFRSRIGPKLHAELRTGYDIHTGPLAVQAERIQAVPSEATWRRIAWVTELTLDHRVGTEADLSAPTALALRARHTYVLSGEGAALTNPMAPWVPGLVLQHRPLFLAADGRWTLGDRFQTDLTLRGGLASPLPGLQGAWWTGWQAFGVLGLTERLNTGRGSAGLGLALELRSGRPGDPDLAEPDGWLTPDRLGTVGLMGTFTARLP